MAETSLICCMSAVVEMCDVVFPRKFTNETRVSCQRYESQVVRPLLQVAKLRQKRTAEVIQRVANWMCDDGKYDDSQQLCLKAVEIHSQLLGKEVLESLNAHSDLAAAYWRQGRWAEAAELEEKGLIVRRKVLGDDHPDTLGTMLNLGATYKVQR